MNVADHLAAAALRAPEALAIHVVATGEAITFGELDRQTTAVALGLTKIGIQPDERILVMVRPGIEIITLTYALFRMGALPVLIDPGMGRAAFLACVASMKPTGLIGIPLAHVARFLFPSTFRSVKHAITVGTRWFWGGPTFAQLRSTPGAFTRVEMDSESPAAILFTSGSTGPAKGVLYTHGIFDAQVHALRETYGFEAGEIDVAAFPLFSLFDNALGMTSIIPDIDASKPASARPEKIADAITRFHATTAFGSPVIWRKAAPWFLANSLVFPELRRIMIAGAPISPGLLETLLTALPNGDVGTPYGATEALPVACVWGREILAETAEQTRAGAGTCVGRVAFGIDLVIIGIDDGPIPVFDPSLILPDGEVGEICVRGPQVTRAYVEREDANAAAKMADGTTTWHRMGDLGYRDPQGRIWFCGRKSERVGGLYTDQVEGVFNGWPGVTRSALVGVDGTAILVVEGAKNTALATRITDTGRVARVLFHPAFPVDPRHQSKIHRHTLAAWAKEQAQ